MVRKLFALLAVALLATSAFALAPEDVCPEDAIVVTDGVGGFACYTLDGSGEIDWFYTYWYSSHYAEYIYTYLYGSGIETNWTPIIYIPCSPVGGMDGCVATCTYKEQCSQCVNDRGDDVYNACVAAGGQGCFAQLMAYRLNAWLLCRNKPGMPSS